VRKTRRSRNILAPAARLRNAPSESLCIVHRPFHHKAPDGTGRLRPSNIFSQNTTRQGVGHRACSLRAIVPHLCHPRRPGRALLVGSANRMNPNAVGLDPESSFRKDCPMTMAPIPAVALTPIRLLPGELLPREPGRPRRRLGVGHHGAEARSMSRSTADRWSQ
jgi:hypothetical protein